MSNLDQESLIRDFTHLTIPAEIWLRRDLSIQAKALWAEIRSLHSKSRGGCFASDEYLMEFMNLKRSRLFEIVKELKDKKLLTIVGYFDGRTIRKAHLEEITPDSESGKPDQKSGKVDYESGIPDSSVRDPGFISIYHSKDDKKAKEVAQSAPQLRKNDSISFSHESKEFTGIGQKDLDEWKDIYPQVDIKRELLAMKQWLLSNESKSHKKKWRAFIIGWLSRNNEKAENKAAYKSQKSDSVDRRTKNQDGTPIKPIYDDLF